MREPELARELTRAHQLIAVLRAENARLQRALEAAHAALRPVAKGTAPPTDPRPCTGYSASGQPIYDDEPAYHQAS